ncbi:MAG: hypothetical protein AAB501_03510 [Patescibacteria group bacterium]
MSVKRKKWTKEMVVQEIRELHQNNGRLNSGHIKKDLYAAAWKLFGSWKNAIEAYGLDYDKVRAQRPHNSLSNKENIVAEIIKRHKQGLPLNGKSVMNQDKSLYESARKQFGARGWQKALLVAGLDPDIVQKRKFWTKGKIQHQIYNLLKANVPLHGQHLVINGMEDLFRAGVEFFGSWKATIESCGLDYELVKRRGNKKWTPESIIAEIKTLKQRGVRLNSKNIQTLRRSLVSAGKRYFGSWGQAVDAAGMSYQKESIRWTYLAWLKTLSLTQLETIDKQAREFGLKMRRDIHERDGRKGKKK